MDDLIPTVKHGASSITLGGCCSEANWETSQGGGKGQCSDAQSHDVDVNLLERSGPQTRVKVHPPPGHCPGGG